MTFSDMKAFTVTLNKDIVIVELASGSLSNFFTAGTFSAAELVIIKPCHIRVTHDVCISISVSPLPL
jgi:hypothetical protein